MVQDGRVAALWGAGIGWPGFAAVAKSPAGARFIVPDAEQVKRILAKHALLKPLAVPAGSYPGQDAPIASVGSWAFVIARPTLARRRRLSPRARPAQGRGGHREAPAAGEGDRPRPTPWPPRRAPTSSIPGAQRYLREAGFLR